MRGKRRAESGVGDFGVGGLEAVAKRPRVRVRVRARARARVRVRVRPRGLAPTGPVSPQAKGAFDRCCCAR